MILMIIILRVMPVESQKDTIVFTLKEAISLAREISPDANSARHSFRSEYWNWRSYKANYLPWLTLNSSPYYDRAINAITQSDGSVKFVEQNLLRTNANLTLSQNIRLTGGNLFIKSSIERLDILDNENVSWQTVPVTIGYSQSLFGYNHLKWNRRLMPIRYEAACREYVETLELIAAKTVSRFFNLAAAQNNYSSAVTNHENATRLYDFAKGRYNIGTITENEMLQLEINMLTEETNKMNALLDLQDNMQSLKSYLCIKDDIPVRVDVDLSLPVFSVNEDDAITLAIENSPDINNITYQKIQSESNVAYARANAGLKADLYMSFGLTQTGEKFRNAYRDPLNQQYVSIGISLPVLDWGKGRGDIKLAKSRSDLVNQDLEQRRNDFEVDVRKTVNQFNLQLQRVKIAAKTEATADRKSVV